MKSISKYILTKGLGWKIRGAFPEINKSIVIFAPHTSYWDALYGKLFLMQSRIHYKFISKKELFFFPMNILMRMYGSICIGGKHNSNTIYQVAHLLNDSHELHIVISPEGTRKKVKRWNKGFYNMALKANVPIVVGYMDYRKKEIGIKGVVGNLKNTNQIMQEIQSMYKNVSARHPKNFSLKCMY